MRRDGGDLSIVYAGRGRNFPYLVKSIFSDWRLRDNTHTTIFGYRRAAERWLHEADLLIVDIGWPYDRAINRAGAFLEIPDWVNMGVELGGDWDELVRQFRKDARKNDLRRVRRNSYDYETTSSKDEIERFYADMYVPYVRFVHGADALLAPRRHVIRRGVKGALIKVKRSGEVVAAGIVYPDGNVLVSMWMGIPAHLHEHPPEASISALYVFLLRYALENGFAAVDFAGTRPLLTDGIFQFKRKWGAVVEDTFSPSSILLQLISGRPQTIAFCCRFPVVVRSHRGLEGLVCHSDNIDNAIRLEQLSKQLVTRGLERLIVVSVAAEGERSVVARTVDGVQIAGTHISPKELSSVYTQRWLDFFDAAGDASADGVMSVDSVSDGNKNALF